MATETLRREVLQSFKQIHRTRCIVFKGDKDTLECARKEINAAYRSKSKETNAEEIKKLISFAYDVIKEMKTNVLQMVEVEPGKFKPVIRPEMLEDQGIPDSFERCSSKKKKK